MARRPALLRSTLPLPRFTGADTRSSVPVPSPGAAVRAAVVETGTQYGVGTAMIDEWNADAALRYGLYANVYVYAALTANGVDISALPGRAGRDLNKMTTYDLDSPLAMLLGPAPGRPNPTTTSEQLIAWSVVQRRTTGRVAWELVWQNGRVVALYPLPSNRLTAVPSSGGANLWKEFRYDTGHGIQVLSAEQVMYHWKPSQQDWRQSESALQAARLDISVAVMQDRYDVAFLRNDARPAAVIVHEQFANTDDRDAWRAQFLDDHQGPDNAGRAHFMEAGGGLAATDALSIHTVGLSQKDGEFIRRYESKIRGILVALGTPLSRLGDATGRTYNNAGHESRNYWKNTLYPEFKDLASAVNLQVAPKVGTGTDVFWFDYSGVKELQPERQFALSDIPSLIDAALLTPNEGRELLGLSRIDEPWADEYHKKQPAPVVVAPPADATDETDEQEDVDDVDSQETTPVAAALEPGEQRADVDGVRVMDHQERSVAIGAAQQEGLERQWTRAMRRLFKRQQDAALSRLTGKRGRQAVRADEPIPNADGIFDRAFWLAETETVVGDLYELSLTTAESNLRPLIGASFDLDSPWARAFISSRANLLAGQVTETTYRDIIRLLSAGMEQGLGIPAMADSIRDLFVQTYSSRAETVARTEVISSYNGATWDIAQQYGSDVVAGYEWLATLDARVRPDHRGAHGQISVGGSMFQVGGSMMRYPGDSAGGAKQCVNCRCTLLALTEAELEARGIASSKALDDELAAALAQVYG